MRKKIDEVGPFLNLTEQDFSIAISDQAVRKSKHEAIDRQLRLISARQERAAHKVDDVERLIGIETRWQRSEAEYERVLKYISNRKFVRVIKEL